jgi:hypothetical protein
MSWALYFTQRATGDGGGAKGRRLFVRGHTSVMLGAEYRVGEGPSPLDPRLHSGQDARDSTSHPSPIAVAWWPGLRGE